MYISEGTNFDKLFFNTDTVTVKKQSGLKFQKKQDQNWIDP